MEDAPTKRSFETSPHNLSAVEPVFGRKWEMSLLKGLLTSIQLLIPLVLEEAAKRVWTIWQALPLRMHNTSHPLSSKG